MVNGAQMSYIYVHQMANMTPNTSPGLGDKVRRQTPRKLFFVLFGEFYSVMS